MGTELNTSNRLITEKSGTTAHIDYSFEDKILEVEYIDGDLYHYLNVPATVWKEYKHMVECGESSGKYVNREVKPNFEFRKIR